MIFPYLEVKHDVVPVGREIRHDLFADVAVDVNDGLQLHPAALALVVQMLHFAVGQKPFEVAELLAAEAAFLVVLLLNTMSDQIF